MLSGIYAMFTSADKLPLWQHLAFLVLSPALGAMGGSLQARSAARAGVRLDEAVARSTRQRVGLVVNGLLIALASFVSVVFGSFGIAGYLQGQRALIVGAAVFAAIVLTGTWLLMAARRALRGGGRRHWPLHVSGLALVVVPIVVIVAVGAHAR
jgi:cation transporter-like permease